jgi:hypothetical protein
MCASGLTPSTSSTLAFSLVLAAVASKSSSLTSDDDGGFGDKDASLRAE